MGKGTTRKNSITRIIPNTSMNKLSRKVVKAYLEISPKNRIKFKRYRTDQW